MLLHGGRITRSIQFGILLFVIFVVFIAPSWIDARMKANRKGPDHIFQLEAPPEFLTEELAMKTAFEALRLDGLDPDDWSALPDDRSVAPDDTPDRFICRNTTNPNNGRIQFVRKDRKGARTVCLELRSDHVVAYVWLPK